MYFLLIRLVCLIKSGQSVHFWSIFRHQSLQKAPKRNFADIIIQGNIKHQKLQNFCRGKNINEPYIAYKFRLLKQEFPPQYYLEYQDQISEITNNVKLPYCTVI